MRCREAVSQAAQEINTSGYFDLFRLRLRLLHSRFAAKEVVLLHTDILQMMQSIRMCGLKCTFWSCEKLIVFKMLLMFWSNSYKYWCRLEIRLWVRLGWMRPNLCCFIPLLQDSSHSSSSVWFCTRSLIFLWCLAAALCWSQQFDRESGSAPVPIRG